MSKFSVPDTGKWFAGDGDRICTAMHPTVYSRMEEYDLKAVYTYLLSIQPVKKQVTRFTPAP